MTNEAQEIEKKALSLPSAEREILVNHLFQSVHNQELIEFDEAWLSLAEERWNSYRANPEAGIDKKGFLSVSNTSIPVRNNLSGGREQNIRCSDHASQKETILLG